MRQSIALFTVLASLGLAEPIEKRQDAPSDTRQFSLPVEATAFTGDPALSTAPLLTIETISPTDDGSVSLPFFTNTDTASGTTATGTTATGITVTQTGTVTATTTVRSSTAAQTTASAPSSSALTSGSGSSSDAPPATTLTGTHTTTHTTTKETSSTSNPAAMPTAFANAAGVVAMVGLALVL
ncbi:hypothetical protein PT974_11774 [Cladobotryum mycophilum]|uniref:GPI anchored protein n=1 Tax=Cladobotryum mycophilum TaxID=491253 RepID=A0ABR0S670_9HYPO